MDKLVAVVFRDETGAYDGVRALSDLDAEGSIDVTAVHMVTKAPDGTVSTREVSDEAFPIHMLPGTAVGALVGILAGPVGAAGGAAVGALAGLIGDLYGLAVDADFVTDVGTALTAGKCAVIAEVDEEWVSPLDTRMEALGGVVYRTLKSTVKQDQWTREVADAKAELAQLKIEHAQARADRKARLLARIEDLGKRIDAKLARIKARSEQLMREHAAKVKALEQKAAERHGDAKAAVEARLARLRKDHQSQSHA